MIDYLKTVPIRLLASAIAGYAAHIVWGIPSPTRCYDRDTGFPDSGLCGYLLGFLLLMSVCTAIGVWFVSTEKILNRRNKTQTEK